MTDMTSLVEQLISEETEELISARPLVGEVSISSRLDALLGICNSYQELELVPYPQLRGLMPLSNSCLAMRSGDDNFIIAELGQLEKNIAVSKVTHIQIVPNCRVRESINWEPVLDDYDKGSAQDELMKMFCSYFGTDIYSLTYSQVHQLVQNKDFRDICQNFGIRLDGDIEIDSTSFSFDIKHNGFNYVFIHSATSDPLITKGMHYGIAEYFLSYFWKLLVLQEWINPKLKPEM